MAGRKLRPALEQVADAPPGVRHRRPRRIGRTVWIIGLLFLSSAWTRTEASNDRWQRWAEHDPFATAVIDHRAWGEFLAEHVVEGTDGINRIDYAGVTVEERRLLADYIDAMTAVQIRRYNRDEQLAYWANLYNASTVSIVIDHHPVESIRDIRISPGLFSIGPWGRKIVTVDGIELSLDDIEHRIMRPTWQDPRIHYMVNCAAVGCPNLQPRPFVAHRLAETLDEIASEFVNHPRGALVVDGRLRVSSIFHWYEEDFGGSDATVIEHLRHYALPPLAARLSDIGRIAGHDYDWTLNDLTSESR